MMFPLPQAKRSTQPLELFLGLLQLEFMKFLLLPSEVEAGVPEATLLQQVLEVAALGGKMVLLLLRVRPIRLLWALEET
jgi:hypothetical protein